jgi:hypothetical protein
LVSGSPDVTKNIEAPKNASTADVVLWQGVDPSGVDRVSAPLVAISPSGHSSHAGAYAWWVGDENSKALVKRQAEPAAADLAKAMSGVQAPETVAFHKHPVFDLPHKKLARNDAKLDKIASYETIDLLGLDPAAAAKSFHDLTPYSMGVLTDVARGGLKRDLSLYLDHPIDQPLAVKLPNERRLYPNGITWEELWLFHNVWRALEPPHPNLQSKTGGVLAGDSLILMTPAGKGGGDPASVDAFRKDPYSIYKLPNFIRAHWMLSLEVEKKPDTTPTEYEFYWTTEGIMTLWNPFDVPIALHPDAHMTYKYWVLPYKVKLEDGVGAFVDQDFSGGNFQFDMIFGTGDLYPSGGYDYGRIAGTPETVVLLPGEVLIMSAPIANSRNIAMNAGWKPGQEGRRRKANLQRQPSGPIKFSAYPRNYHMAGSTRAILNQSLTYGPSSSGAPFSFREIVGGRSVNFSDKSLTAASFPNVFTPISVELPTIGTLVGSAQAHPVMLFSHQLKTEESHGLWPWSRLYNPRNLLGDFTKLDDQTLALSGHEIQVVGLSGSRDSKMLQLSPNQSGDQMNRGLFGGSYVLDPVPGQDTVITLSVPREPPLSLGAFQHAVANGNTGRYESGGGLDLHSHIAPQISHAISNSYALPVLGANETETSQYQDHSYHVNRMLWDSWFLSTITQAQAPHHSNKQTAREVYEDFISESAPVPLSNGRMKSWKGYGENTVEDVFDRSEGPHELASSKMMIEGVFNVNSTSVEAWKALFGSLENAFVPVSPGTNSPGTVTPHKSELVTVPSLLTPYGNNTDNLDAAAFESAATTTAEEPAQWRGNRKLTPTEIEELAKAMVEEVKNRGPFLSMADFVNRRPSTDRPLALRGPLQAALDKTVNKRIFDAANRVGTSPASAAYEFPEAAQLPKSMTTSAHVLQADMLTAIGPQLTVRSDTFRIRAYGEAHDKNGRVTAKAWCEAVVQRVPAYLDAIDPAYAADAPVPDPEPRLVPPLGSQANKQFGRRIDLISFRWLHESEVSN